MLTIGNVPAMLNADNKFIFIDVEQRTEEWHNLRRDKIGASACPAIMGESPYATPGDVWDQMVLGKETKVTPAMQRGTDLEDAARIMFNTFHRTNFEPAVTVSQEFPFMMASLDGIDQNIKKILEIKIPGKTVFQKCLDQEIPEYWKWQIQHQLAVTGYQEAILYVFKEDNGLTFYIRRDETKIKKLIEAEGDFYYHHVLEFSRPELSCYGND